jgi:hypothetical protein
MNGVGSVGAVGTMRTAGDAGVIDPTTGRSLLPPPSLGDDQMDTMALLYLMQTKMREQGMKDGKQAVEINHAAVQDALRKEHEALQKAVDEGKKGGFWDDFGKTMLTVAKVAAVVGSIALAIGTCGAGTAVAVLAIAGAVMSTAGFVQGEFHVLEKLGVDADTAKWIGLGLSIGGAACSVGAGLASTAAAAGDAADAGANAGQATQTTASAADAGQAGSSAASGSNAFTTGSRVAGVASGAATIAGGAAKIEAGDAHADEQQSMAEALKEQTKAQWLQRQLLALVDAMKDSDQSDGRVLDGIRGAMATHGDTLVTSASMRA